MLSAMPWAYGTFFAVLATGLMTSALRLGGGAWLLSWPAASSAVLAAGYLGLGPRVLGKRANGTFGAWSIALHLPYLAVAWGIWSAIRRLGREDSWNEVIPGVFVGRRCLARELPEGVALVIDLTAELAVPADVRRSHRVVCVPTLDGSVPDEATFRAVVQRIAESEEPVFVHCAAGHGRSAAAVVAALLVRGVDPDLEAAIARLRRARPAVHMGPEQRAMAGRAVVRSAP